MKKTLVILKREYLTRVRTKAFVIGTLVTPFLMGVLTILPGFLATRGGGQRHITVLDQSGDPELFDVLKNRLSGSSAEASASTPLNASTNVALCSEDPTVTRTHRSSPDTVEKSRMRTPRSASET